MAIMKKSSIFFNFVLIISILLIIAFVIYLLSSKWICDIKLSSDVVPVDVISLLISSFITLLVGYYIAKVLSEQRVEKDLLIEDLKSIENHIIDVENLLNDYSKVSIQQLSVGVEKAIKRTNRFENNLKIFDKHLSCKKLIDKCSDLYKDATDINGNDGISIDDLPVDRIQDKCGQVINELRQLIHNINKR